MGIFLGIFEASTHVADTWQSHGLDQRLLLNFLVTKIFSMASEQAKMNKAMERDFRFPNFGGIHRVPITNEITNRWSTFAPFPMDITPPRIVRTQSDAQMDAFADLKRKRAEAQEEADILRDLDEMEARKRDRQVIYEVKVGKLTVKIIEDGNGDLDHEVYEGDVQVLDF